MPRRYRVQNEKLDLLDELSLVALIETVDLDEDEVDDIVDLEVGQSGIYGRTHVERVE